MRVLTLADGDTTSSAPPTKGITVEVRIGVQNVARELAFESTQSVEEVTAAVNEALKKGGTLDLSDEKGRKYVVPVSALGFVHIGETEKSRVGFGTD
jgi:hypothetical protein